MPDFILVLIIILIAALVMRGPKTLPKLGEALGRGVKAAKAEAKQAQADIQARASSSTTATPADATSTTEPPR